MVYLQVFLVGGIICLIGQLLINYTHMTSSRILVIFLLAGSVLEAVGLFQYIEDFGKAGATIPITGFGKALAKGAMEGAMTDGFLGAISGGLMAVAGPLSVAVGIGFIIAVIFKSKTKA